MDFYANGDGNIFVSEFRSVSKALGFEADMSLEELNNAVTEIDMEDNGAIDLHEFADFHPANASNGGLSFTLSLLFISCVM